MEKARLKAKAAVVKFERSSLLRFEKDYSRQKELECRYHRDKWSLGHK